MVEFRVLGPLEVRGRAGAVDLGGVKQRLTLSLLLMRANEFVSRDELVDALWPDDPPASARQTVESYVSRVRRVLRSAGVEGEAVESGPAGYRLSIDGNVFDRDEVKRLVRGGREARARGNLTEAAERAKAALALWRGPTLAGLADHRAVSPDASALDELRLQTLEAWAQAELDLGQPSDAIGLLRAELLRHPEREQLCALLMLALYRAGRQAEALEVYRDVRRHLAGELGLEPSAVLRELQGKILRQDVELDLRSSSRSPAAPALEARAEGVPAASRPSRARRRHALAAAGLAAVAAGVIALVLSQGERPSTTGRLASNAAGLALLDPATGQVREAASTLAGPTRIAAAGGAVWATDYDAGTLLRVDLNRGVVVQTIHVGNGPTGVTIGAGDVWVADTLGGSVERIDPGTNQVVQRIAVGSSPTEVAVGAGSVWVVNSGDATVSRIDPRNGRVLGTTDVGPGPSGLAVAFGSVWVAQRGPGAVARLDASSGRVRQDIHVGSGPSAIAVGPGGIWVTNELDSTVSRIDPARGAVTLTRAVAGTPAGLAAVGGRLYVASRDLPVLTEIGRGVAGRELRLPSPVSAVAAGGGRLLVAMRGSGVDHRGGTLRVRSAWVLSLPDTHGCCDVPPFLRNASYDGLLAYATTPGTTGVLIPDLAMAVPQPEDNGRTYTFTLRPGLRYWTGRPVRASDVRRGLEVAARSSPIAFGLRALRGASACPSPHPRCNLGAAVTSDDRARTVTFHLSARDPELLYQLASSRLAPAPSLRQPVPGTGPYRIARIAPGRLIDLRRNPYYRPWAPAAQPPGFPDRILWETGRNPVESVRAVLAGRADYSFDSPTPEQAAYIRLHAAGQLHVEPVAGVQFAFLNTRVAPFDDVRVRRALNFATDRRAIARRVGVGTGTPLCQVVPSTILGHLPYCPYTRKPTSSGRWSGPDLRRARALVAASGTRGTRITYYAGADQPDTMVSDREIAGALRRLGYRVRFRVLAGERWFSTVSDAGRHAQIGTGDIWADYPSASPWLVFGLGCKSFDPAHPSRTFNDAEFCDATVDRWARRAIRLEASDPAAAGRLWARTDRRVTDLAPWVPVIQPSEVDFVSRRVGDYRYLPTIGPVLQRLWVR